MNIEDISLQDCPYCGGAGLLDDGSGWCWTVTCMDCGAQTGEFEFSGNEDRLNAAMNAARIWNMGKVTRSDPGE